MNLIKWIRKNERKILAIVVIILMIGFIGGSYLSQLGRGGFGRKVVIARYGTEGEITNYDRMVAQRQLEILKSIYADRMLRGQDLRGIFLSELLFSEGRITPELLIGLKRAIGNEGLRISDSQIRSLYQRTVPVDIYWILLKAEAENAGVFVTRRNSEEILSKYLPQLFNGATYSQVISSLQRRGITEEMVLDAFSDLLAVLEYARIVCAGEYFTDIQVRHLMKLGEEVIDVNLVRFDATLFVDRVPPPTEEQIRQQFEKYRDVLPGHFSEDNPYGFGYKLDDMVVLEYLVLKLDDISKTVSKPTQQEMEDYYQSHLDRFTEQVPSNPNDPNSPKIERTIKFGRVAKLISDTIYQQRVISKADLILSDAKRLAEKNYVDVDIDELDVEKLKSLAVDYNDLARLLEQKYGIEIYAGRTGLLSLRDMRMDEYLSGLFLKSSSDSRMPLSLSQVVFSIEQFGENRVTLQQNRAVKLYENIGPVQDIRGRVAGLFRVVEAQKARPASLEEKLVTGSFILDESDGQSLQEYTIEEKVKEDLKKLVAMEIARQTAEEFAQLAKEKGWDTAIAQFNERFDFDVNEPNSFSIASWHKLRRYSEEYIEALAFRSDSEVSARFTEEQSIREAEIIHKLYSLLAMEDKNSPELPIVIRMEPDMSYYVIKDISVDRLYRDEYQSKRAAWANQLESIEIQNLAAVHFQPDNIIKRMNFRFVEKGKARKEPNDTAVEANEG